MAYPLHEGGAMKKPQKLSLRRQTLKTLETSRIAGGGWTTPSASAFIICFSMECTLFPTCLACTGGGGGGLSTDACPQ
jgi:hypothetical protein